MGIKKAIGLIGFSLFADIFKGRFVAGSSIEDAARQAKILSERKEKAVINILGEHAKTHKEVLRFRGDILKLIKILANEGLADVNIAIKPSQLGLDISEYLYFRNLADILDESRIFLPDAFVEIDAEDHSYREQVLRVALRLKDFPNLRLACQANRRAAFNELVQIAEAGISIRLCKGNAYLGDIIGPKELRRAFLEMVPFLIEKGKNPAFATHDLCILDFIAKHFYCQKHKFELELLMGIERNLCRELKFREFTLRRYVPYGPNWRPYGKRRAEVIMDIWWRNFWHRRCKS